MISEQNAMLDNLKKNITWEEANNLLHALGSVLKCSDRYYEYVQQVRNNATNPKQLVHKIVAFFEDN